MTVPDPQSLGGVLAGVLASAVGYYKYMKAPPRATWQQEDCEEAIRKAVKAFTIEYDQQWNAIRESLDLIGADHAKRLGHLEADARSAYRFRNDVEERLVWLESARRAPPKPQADT